MADKNNQEQENLSQLLQIRREKLKELQDQGKFTELMMRQEELKTYPVGDVWNYFCEVNGVPAQEDWFAEVEKYEAEVLSKRQ